MPRQAPARNPPASPDDAERAVLTEIRFHGYHVSTKATIEFPDDLYRKVKAKSALEGRSVRSVALDLFRRWLGESTRAGKEKAFVSFHDVARDFCGVVDSGVADLATNPEHLGDLGRDSFGDR